MEFFLPKLQDRIAMWWCPENFTMYVKPRLFFPLVHQFTIPTELQQQFIILNTFCVLRAFWRSSYTSLTL